MNHYTCKCWLAGKLRSLAETHVHSQPAHTYALYKCERRPTMWLPRPGTGVNRQPGRIVGAS